MNNKFLSHIYNPRRNMYVQDSVGLREENMNLYILVQGRLVRTKVINRILYDISHPNESIIYKHSYKKLDGLKIDDISQNRHVCKVNTNV